jgi:hypothetical protein
MNVASIDALKKETFASKRYKSQKYALPPFPEPSTSCDLLLLFCHLFASSNSIHLFDIAPFSDCREALSHSLVWEEGIVSIFQDYLTQKNSSQSSRQFSGLKM